MSYQYIAIEGNIGAGKTELVKLVAEEFNMETILEEFAGNVYLERFYQDPQRYAFPLEISFLVERYQQLNHHFSTGNLFKSGFVSDYFFDKSLVFASRNLNQDQFHLFKRLFDVFTTQVKFPDLLLYIHRPIERLKSQIDYRARAFESRIGEDYLKSIEQGYLEYLKTITNCRVIYINLGKADFLKDEHIREKLFGLIRQKQEKGWKRVDFSQ